MHAVIAGGRRGGGHSGSRYMFSGSSEEGCNWWRFCSVLSFSLAGIGALGGIMLTVFGSTGFFRTNELNEALVIVGIVSLVSAVIFLGAGFVFSRKIPPEPTNHVVHQTSQRNVDQDYGDNE